MGALLVVIVFIGVVLFLPACFVSDWWDGRNWSGECNLVHHDKCDGYYTRYRGDRHDCTCWCHWRVVWWRHTQDRQAIVITQDLPNSPAVQALPDTEEGT